VNAATRWPDRLVVRPWTLGFLESGRHVCVQNSRPVEYVVVLLSPR
jgi:hypothetical protein